MVVIGVERVRYIDHGRCWLLDLCLSFYMWLLARSLDCITTAGRAIIAHQYVSPAGDRSWLGITSVKEVDHQADDLRVVIRYTFVLMIRSVEVDDSRIAFLSDVISTAQIY